MDELKLLVEMVKELPNAALFVLAGYLFYKLVIIGSIYGLVRFCIREIPNGIRTIKLARASRTFDKEMVERIKTLDTDIHRMVITDHEELLKNQLQRIKFTNARLHESRSRTDLYQEGFIHQGDIVWLARAIDEKLERDGIPE